ncbi:Ycf66 family protein [Roseofilum casamattae]|uniref:Ycf66 family protein n=1 Tax=Roseofilum casamattae BLCC-M143 TaxID=3022442 RepID=A0ABT7C2I4_9CYAN|nr:Ycf66 family protein [Roseofilum casamattae]MDJ1185668.1 Ycf66 family protein [Roseofilum casamattae BLCC-M143]
MVNIGLNPGALLGVVLFGAGAGLYFLRSVRPELARDHDIFFMAVAVLSGGILFFQGWRLDPILTFGQFLLTGSAIFFAVESIRLRGLATSRAKQNTPIVDEDRPVSRAYTYDSYDPRLDRLEPAEDTRPRRKIGPREERYDRGDRFEEDYPRRSSSSRRRTAPRSTPAPSGSGRRPSRRPSGAGARSPEDWDNGNDRSGRYEDPYSAGEDDRSYRNDEFDVRPPVEPRRPSGSERPRPESDRRPREPRNEDYVDFEPMDDLRKEGYDRPDDGLDDGLDDGFSDTPSGNFDY